MIELNLLERKQPFRLPLVLGIDFNVLNFKMIGVAIFLFYIPDYFVQKHFDSALKEEEVSLEEKVAAFEKIEREIGKNKNINAQLDAYNRQIEKLKSRSLQVDEVLKVRTNPKKILEMIARSLPEDLWFDSLVISENKDIKISGGSYSTRSITAFLTIINPSPFFANSIVPSKQETRQETIDGEVENYELFEFKGKIKNFDMRSTQ